MVAFSQVKPQALKLRALPQYPVRVRAEKFLTSSISSGVLTLDVDYSLLGQFAYTDLSNKKFPVLDTVTGQYGLVSIQDAVGGVTSFAGLTGDMTLGYGLSMSSKKLILNDLINVKNYGAVGNGSTNDTAAINLAIAAQGIANNAYTDVKTLYFPQGTYIVTPGALAVIYGSVYGPNATVMASSTADAPLFTLYYRDNGAEMAQKSFDLFAILGGDQANNYATRLGTGIMVQTVDGSSFKIAQIKGFRSGIYLNGGDYNLHQGTSRFDIGIIFQCRVGIKMNAGDSSIANGGPDVSNQAFQESHRFTINYMNDFTEHGIFLGGGASNTIVDNVFDIIALGPNRAGGNGITVTSQALRNKFTVRSWDAGNSGGGYCLSSGGADNLFRVPWSDLSVYQILGTDIWDFVTDATVVNSGTLVSPSRSQLIRAAAPTTGAWRVGDRCWNNAPSTNGSPGWVCVTAGTPGTWEEMAVLGKRTGSADAANLNTITTPGDYSGNTNTNGPVAGAFFLNVQGNFSGDTGYVKQVYTVLGSTPDTYMRASISGVFTAWKQYTLV